jgi:pimeloyl-ACP methyl ester carboxylesterase
MGRTKIGALDPVVGVGHSPLAERVYYHAQALASRREPVLVTGTVLLSRDVGLDTHVADVTNLMIWENLRDIVLVGHSYGGVVARHVADRMPDGIRSLIYLDAFVPENGKALFDYLPDDGKSLRELAVAHGDGWKIACGHDVMLDMPNELTALLLQRT